MQEPNLYPSLQKLFLTGREYQFRKGQVLQSSDDTLKFSLVKTGFVKRYLIANDGNLSVQSIYGAGDIFPLTHIFRVLLEQEIYQGPEIYYYETITDVVASTIDNDILIDAVRDNPMLYRDLLVVAGQRLQSNIEALENLSLHSAYQRVAQLLCVFGRHYGTVLPAGIKIDMPLTHLLIANILDVTRETVSQGIIQLREKGLIKTNKHVTIPDIKALEQEAYSPTT
jgi:CRP-like cAMP-binding protein